MGELTFHLKDFDGPLELLLALVQAHKMDLHDIPILELIDQYTRVVSRAQQQEPDAASSFVAMAAQLVEMKSRLLLPRSPEAEQLKQELTGRLIEYDRCRRLAGQLRSRARGVEVYTRLPARLAGGSLYPLRHAAQALADCWQAMAGRARPQPLRQEAFQPLVAAPFVSVESRVVHVLRGLATGKVDRLAQLFSREQELSATVATFLAVLELVRSGRVAIAPDGGLSIRRGRLPPAAQGGGDRAGPAGPGRPERKNKMEQAEMMAVLEAVLFAHGDPVGAGRLAAALDWPESLVLQGLDALQARYMQPDSGLTLLRLGDHWQLATKNEYGAYVRRTLDTRRAAPLSQAALETLTVIAYNQPVSRAFIEQVRGVDSSSSVSSLLEKGLIEEAGRLDLPGRPVSFRTTDHFLRVFGLSSLDGLPPVHGREDEQEKEVTP